MGVLSDTYANASLDALLGASHASTWPATVYVGLKASGVEPTGNGYARVAVTNDSTRWPAASGRAKHNGQAITYPTPTGSWGTCDEVFVADAATAGVQIIAGSLATPRAIDGSSDPPHFAAGALVFTVPS